MYAYIYIYMQITSAQHEIPPPRKTGLVPDLLILSHPRQQRHDEAPAGAQEE